jgi:hypothetical protein
MKSRRGLVDPAWCANCKDGLVGHTNWHPRVTNSALVLTNVFLEVNRFQAPDQPLGEFTDRLSCRNLAFPSDLGKSPNAGHFDHGEVSEDRK